MKRLLILLSVGFISIFTHADDLIDKIKSTNTIVVATEGNYPPFSFHDETGKLTGYDVEISEAVAAKLNLKVKFAETQWDAIFAGLNAKRFDVIGNQVGITPEREAKYTFSIPYSVSNPVVVVHKDNNSVKSLQDIKGLNAAQSLTSNWSELATKNGANIVAVEGFSQAALLISQKRADLAFNDKIAFLDFAKKSKDTPIKIAFEQNDLKQKSAFAFRKGNEEVVQLFDNALSQLKKEGKLQAISKKWFGIDISE